MLVVQLILPLFSHLAVLLLFLAHRHFLDMMWTLKHQPLPLANLIKTKRTFIAHLLELAIHEYVKLLMARRNLDIAIDFRFELSYEALWIDVKRQGLLDTEFKEPQILYFYTHI